MSYLFKGIPAIAALVSGLMFGSVALADDLEKVKEMGELRVALSGAFPPFSFVDEQNQVVGFDVDIGTELAKRLGVKAKIITTPWDGIIAGLITGKYETIVGSMTITEERKKSISFVGPYYRGGRGIFVLESSSIQSLADISGKTVAVTLGETHEKWSQDQDGWSVKTYKGLPELLLEVGNGRVDAIVADKVPVLVGIKQNNLPFRQIEIPGIDNKSDVGIAIRQNNPDLAAALQKALDEMQADGTYEAISIKWVGSDIR